MYACLLGTILISNGIPVSTPSIYFQPEWGQVQKKDHRCLNKNVWWRHIQPFPLHLFNLLILVDNETVPSLLYVVLCNCKTGFWYIQNMHPKTQWYLPIPVKVTHNIRDHGQTKDMSKSMCKFVMWFRLSRTHKVPPVIQNTYRKASVFVTLTWYAIRSLYVEICEVVWAEHTKYYPFSG